MKSYKIIFIFLLLYFIPILSCKTNRLPVKDIVITKSENQTILVHTELAVSNEEKQHGYMERKNIPAGTGMIFVYDRDQIMSFWMKNTPHPLSIAYIDSKGVIREIYDMKPYSLSPVTSKVSVRYALEVPQGWYSENGIRPGDKISLDFLN